MESVVPEFARGQSEAGPRGDLVWLVDWIVGQVTDALERTGKTENTLIFITSDNGALPGDRIPDQSGQMPYHLYDHKSCGHWRVTKRTSGKVGIANLSSPDGLVLLSQEPLRINSFA